MLLGGQTIISTADNWMGWDPNNSKNLVVIGRQTKKYLNAYALDHCVQTKDMTIGNIQSQIDNILSAVHP